MHSAYYSNSRIPILQVHSNRFTFQSILVSETLLRSRQCKFYFKKFDSTKSTSSSGSSFIHSTLLRAPIGIEFYFYFKEHSVSHTPFVCTHMDQGLNAEPGTFFKNKDSMWQILQATRKQVLLCI